MKNLFIFCVVIFTLSVPTYSFAQKCKYYSDTNDPVSGERQRVCNNKLDSDVNYRRGYLQYKRAGEEYTLDLGLMYVGSKKFIIPENTEVKIKLGNGEVMVLNSMNSATPLVNANTTSIFSIYNVLFSFTEEQMNEISLSGFSAISTKIDGQNVFFTIKPKKVKNTADQAKCILMD